MYLRIMRFIEFSFEGEINMGVEAFSIDAQIEHLHTQTFII
jgi:hypothetical protein